MATSGKIFAADLGSGMLKGAVFHSDPATGLTLQSYAMKDLGMDPNKNEDRPLAVGRSLALLLAECPGASGLPVFCALSGQFVFTRFVKLPPVAPQQVDQMVVFEAQQNVPFPIHEVVWDYQLLGGVGGRDLEAVIVAVKSEIVEEANGILMGARLQTDTVDVVPMALMNAFLYNYPEKRECSLIIDIGAKSTDLCFLEEGRAFCRVVPIGGNVITQNICNEFQEPFVAAEMMKKGRGYVGLGGAYQDPEDETAARISKLARSAFTRLHAEISRSVGFYRNQQGGSAPACIYLAGGTAAMAYADLFLKEKFNVPVEFLNPFRRVTLARGIDQARLSAEAFQLAPVVGMGLRALGNPPFDVRLVPPSIQAKQERQRRAPFLTGAILAWAAVFAVAVGGNFLLANKFDNDRQQLDTDYNSKKLLAQKIDQAYAEYARVKVQVEALDRLTEQRNYWPELMKFVTEQVSGIAGLWITRMDLSLNGTPIDAKPVDAGKTDFYNVAETANQLNLRGFYETSLKVDLVSELVTRLKQSPKIKDVELVSHQSRDEDQVALLFYVCATLKEDAQPDLKP